MKLVRSRARDHIDDRPPGEAIFGAEVRLLHLELLHRFRRWNIRGRRDSAIGFGVRDRSAIGQNVGRGSAAAVGDEVRAGAGDVALIVHLGDARR